MNIAIISPGVLPIPATMGGAIETLTTHLINRNEYEQDNLKLTIFNRTSKNDLGVGWIYKNTKVQQLYSSGIFSNGYNLFWRSLRVLSLRQTYHRTDFIRKCIREIKKENYDFVLIEGNYTQVLQIKKQVKCKIILHLHTDILNINTPLAKEITNACEKILVISDFLKRRIIEIDKENESKTYVFKNAIDVNRFDRKQYLDYRELFRKEIEVKSDCKLVMYCGRLSKEKGVRELLVAFEKISNLNCKLLIVGSSWFSSNKKNDYIIELEKIAKRFESKVLFTGYIAYDDLPKYYAAADIVVFPSIGNEAAGLVVIEALASGIPVVCSDLGGIPEYATSKACEIVTYDDNFVGNLGNALEKLINNKEYYNNKQKNARESVLEYNVEDYYENFKRIITGGTR